ncbi:sensor histidine kinase [Altibacter sp.]|uniref:tetratricopeptide repeat-containing sensor histidine kinase n=1 Tax=Altibacter sp. TaxID=2024823 RepID=UPI0025B853E1|nr:sensor histidine kinase [Altibacter sp.]
MSTLRSFCFLVFFFSSFLLQSQETLKNIDSALAVLRKAPNDTAKVELLLTIARHYNVTHLDSAKAFAEDGIRLAETLKYPYGKMMNLNVLGNYFERKTDYENAMAQYNKALDIAKATNSTKGFAVVLNNIATIHIRKGDYQKAIPLLFEALKAEEKLGNKTGIAQAYNNIGVAYYYLQDFDKTTQYLTRALEMQEALGNFAGLQNGYNNVGAIYDYQQKYDDAIASYAKALAISKQLGDVKEQASNLTNMALAYSKKGDFTTCERLFLESITLREAAQDFNGMAHSYTTFGESLRLQKRFRKSEEYLLKGVALAEQHDIKLSLKEGYSSLSELAKDQNDFEKANTYLYSYIAVKDSILNEKNSQIIQETEAKYETEKKEKEILQQRAQLAEKDLQVRKKNTLIYGGFGLALLLGILGYLVYNQQKLKNRQLRKEGELKTALAQIETQNRLQEQRLRISRDLHDNIGAQLTFIISSLDNLKYSFKDMETSLSQKLSGISSFTSQTIYELRDTIWAMNKNSITFEDLQSRISNFIEKAKLASEGTQFSFTVDASEAASHAFTSVAGMNLYRIIQEGVNNAIKYSDASEIGVNISEDTSHFLLTIWDNGTGFDPDTTQAGNGLHNMKKRARELGGALDLISEEGKGTTLKVLIPKEEGKS